MKPWFRWYEIGTELLAVACLVFLGGTVGFFIGSRSDNSFAEIVGPPIGAGAAIGLAFGQSTGLWCAVIFGALTSILVRFVDYRMPTDAMLFVSIAAGALFAAGALTASGLKAALELTRRRIRRATSRAVPP